MLVSVLQVENELGRKLPFKFITNANELEIEQPHPFQDGDIVVEGEVVNQGTFLVVQGTIAVEAAYECYRCLTLFTRQETIPFSENYRKTDQSLAPGRNEADFMIYEGDSIDIGELVQETLLLNEPLQPLCSESCLGLCPVCGVNRNQVKCHCNQESIDPRLAALSRLITKN